MQTVTTVGLDIAKSVFQVHAVDAEGKVAIRRQLKRRYVLAFFEKLPPCLIGIEACASAHHWSRELQALGHTVRLMPPAYVKPYVKRHKNDASDAEAICEAVTRPNMRFVPTKTEEQRSCLTLHRTRHLFIRQQTSVINAIRAHLAEFGIVAPVGRHGVEQLSALPIETRATIANMAPEYGATSVYFPIDRETLTYLRLTGREEDHIARVEAYAKAQGLWVGPESNAGDDIYDSVLDFDLSKAEPVVAGPKRPEQRTPLSQIPTSLNRTFPKASVVESGSAPIKSADVVIAAIARNGPARCARFTIRSSREHRRQRVPRCQ